MGVDDFKILPHTCHWPRCFRPIRMVFFSEDGEAMKLHIEGSGIKKGNYENASHSSSTGRHGLGDMDYRWSSATWSPLRHRAAASKATCWPVSCAHRHNFVNFAYKALKIRKLCIYSLLCSALRAKCSYYVVDIKHGWFDHSLFY